MAESSETILRLGTRGSLLAMTQSRLVADELEKRHRGLAVQLETIRTSGDEVADRPLHELGGKGLFTKELEQALLAGAIDFAVHSFKDVPVTMPLVDQSDLVIAAVPRREDPRDVMVSQKATSPVDLPPASRVGTGSMRRRCQLLTLRPDLVIEPIRGNIDTRLHKLREGQFDAIILARAGLRRTGLFDAGEMAVIETDQLLPAPGQGALALQCRRSDDRTRQLLAAVNDEAAELCVGMERSLVQKLQGDCHSPIAALATIADGRVHLTAAVGARNGDPPVIKAEASADRGDADSAVEAVFNCLREQGVEGLLRQPGPNMT